MCCTSELNPRHAIMTGYYLNGIYMSAKRVLIVEDELAIREMMKYTLVPLN